MDTFTKIERLAQDTEKIASERDMLTTDLRSILDLYVDWFDSARLGSARAINPQSMGNAHPSEQSVPNIIRVEDAARKFLVDRLPPDLPAHFVHYALATIESLAYTTSRFAAADRANRLLYRAAALRILEKGFPVRAPVGTKADSN